MSDKGQQLSPQFRQFVQQEQVRMQLQQTVARLTDECWDKCISSPGMSLSQRCFESHHPFAPLHVPL